MKTTIYLYADRKGVNRMRQSLGDFSRNEIPIKLNISIDDKAFRPPVMEQNVHVDEWHEGVDVEDVQFKKNIITGKEAEMIKQQRLEKMKHILQEQGYTISMDEETQ